MKSAGILIVEDHQLATKTLQHDLKQAGHRVISVVDNASECIDYVQQQAVDIVIVDLVLKNRVNGLDVITELRQFSDVAVVYLTAEETDEFIRRAEATRPIAYLLKPLRSRELSFLIRMTLERISIEKRRQREHEEAKADLWYQATFDNITGLPKRTLLLDRLNQIVGKHLRHDRHYALMAFGLDNFRRINESYGTSMGDELLFQLGQRLADAVRIGDTVARLHADVFAVLMELDESNQYVINVITEKLLQTIAEPVVIDDIDITMTASCGISMFPEDSTQSEVLLNNAEAAMYKAKTTRLPSNYRYYSHQMTELATDAMKLETELRKAMDRLEFELYYQPQINIEDNSVIGVEALIRWNHPERGLVLPGEFIQLAEDTGLILPMGSWILRQACHQMKYWQTEGVKVPRLSINISNAQFLDKRLIQQIRYILEDTACNPASIEFELTESCIMRSVEDSSKRLQVLRDLGAGIAVDDFGTGYSSLSYLKKLPLSRLKIDRSFVRDIPEDENDAAIIRAIIALADGLNLDVIAEGVESDKQLEFFRSIGCTKIQGFLFAKPMRALELEAFLQRPHLRSVVG